jgi:hypothetical protein
MDERARHDRTLRLLEARLNALADACERAPGGERRFEPEIDAVVTATLHAVELGLISAREGDAVWAAVARRHPGAAWCREGPRLLAA